ncbi:MAG: flagellin [Desulfovibrio sp.]|jgi:flagellin|nr:flagellin [Desulfovibrio sp.]
MSLVVNHNMMALNTARNLNLHYSRLATSTQRLSSGLRINSAADDAAGLAIRELQRADIATLHQGARNASDAISMIQTADGALSIIDEKLIRMKELAEQAATGTYDSTQRLMIESEYVAMASEITRIANATDFNGMKLLDGTLSADWHDGSGLTSKGKMKIHFGTGNDSAEDYYYIRIGCATASALFGGDSHISTQQAAQHALTIINNAIVSKDKIRAHLGAMQNRLENTINNLNIQAENLQAAESRISDVDVATEMTEFVRNQILAQSAVAMLAQANSLPRMALQLIGG